MKKQTNKQKGNNNLTIHSVIIASQVFSSEFARIYTGKKES